MSGECAERVPPVHHHAWHMHVRWVAALGAITGGETTMPRDARPIARAYRERHASGRMPKRRPRLGVEGVGIHMETKTKLIRRNAPG